MHLRGAPWNPRKRLRLMHNEDLSVTGERRKCTGYANYPLLYRLVVAVGPWFNNSGNTSGLNANCLSPMDASEVQLQCQLDLAWIARASGIGSQNGSQCACHLSEIARVNIRIRVGEIRMIEGVEKFSAELQRESF